MPEESQQPIQISVDKAPSPAIRIASAYAESFRKRPIITAFCTLPIAVVAGFGVQYAVNKPKEAQVVINSGSSDPFQDGTRNREIDRIKELTSEVENAAIWSLEGADIFPFASNWEETREAYYPTSSSVDFTQFRTGAISSPDCQELDMGLVIGRGAAIQSVCPILSKKGKLLAVVTAPDEAQAAKLRNDTKNAVINVLDSSI